MAKKRLKFEEALESLESIVSSLESGELPLDESLKEFEKGLSIYKDCKSVLLDAEKRIEVLGEELKKEDLEGLD